MYKMLE
jgi:hypothetical protein